MAGATAPDDTDGISILAELLGAKTVGHEQQQHEMLYWEFGSQTAVRYGKWKAVQSNKFKEDNHWELFDLEKDISEKNNLADSRPELAKQMLRD